MEHNDQTCTTRYPILLVHGAFFRDDRPECWGRIPDALEQAGATVFFSGHPSACSVEEAARLVTARMIEITRETGCGKLNVIAHSKGGLDIGWAMAYCGAGDYIASVTTLNTPHRGCRWAEHLLERLPAWLVRLIAKGYNGWMEGRGDPAPDFLATVRDLTPVVCIPRDKELSVPECILCRSFGSQLADRKAAQFPLRLIYPLVEKWDGPSDGLVGVSSMAWGESFTLIPPPGCKGVSHWDMTDLNKRHLPGFDLLSFYTDLAANLKARGL